MGRFWVACAALAALASVCAPVSATTPAGDFCDAAAGFQHYSPILCPIAKTRLCWNITASGEMTMRVEAKVEGYVSIGFMSPTYVGAVDVISLFIDGGGPHAHDGYVSNFRSGWTDSYESDAAQNVDVVSGTTRTFAASSSDGHVPGTYTAVTFRRKFNTGDASRDQAIVSQQPVGLIWATNILEKPSFDSAGNLNLPSYLWPKGNKGSYTMTFDDSSMTGTCDSYCAIQMTACGDSQEAEHQYTSMDECKARCQEYLDTSVWATGDLQTDHDVNTLACRINKAHQAENVPSDQDALRQQLCDQAGPTGGGTCGSQCENYCAYMDKSCASSFGSQASCLEACQGGFASTGGSDSCEARSGANRELRATEASAHPRYNTTNFPFYDTAMCRTIHASLAFGFEDSVGVPSWVATGSTQRCALAAPGSSACCDSSRPTCEFYCEEVMENCGGPRAQFANATHCLDFCSAALVRDDAAKLEVGAHTDTSGTYTLGCLTFLASYATSDALCAASKYGDKVCGDVPAELREGWTAPPPSAPSPAAPSTPSTPSSPSTSPSASPSAGSDGLVDADGNPLNTIVDQGAVKAEAEATSSSESTNVVAIAVGAGVGGVALAAVGFFVYKKAQARALSVSYGNKSSELSMEQGENWQGNPLDMSKIKSAPLP